MQRPVLFGSNCFLPLPEGTPRAPGRLGGLGRDVHSHSVLSSLAWSQVCGRRERPGSMGTSWIWGFGKCDSKWGSPSCPKTPTMASLISHRPVSSLLDTGELWRLPDPEEHQQAIQQPLGVSPSSHAPHAFIQQSCSQHQLSVGPGAPIPAQTFRFQALVKFPGT